VLTRAGERLASWTTLRVGGPAADFVEATTRPALYDAVGALDDCGTPVLVLGGGSNLVVADDGFDGTVVRVATAGIAVGGDARGDAEVTVEAGESWEGLVELAVNESWVGLEALAGIPGTVGAAPIQNVGAYGQEVAETIAHVHAYDRLERRHRMFANADCGFGYRTSAFKQGPNRYVIGAVTFAFRRGSLGAPVKYAELAGRLGVEVGARVPMADVRAAVVELRRSKGMVLDADDRDTWSAGSFFMNPFVAPADLPAGAPAFGQPDGRVKTSAAWLVERAGFSCGYGSEQVRVSSKHTLALTNRGGASTTGVLALAREIRTGVRVRFGIELQLEPVLVSCSLD